MIAERLARKSATHGSAEDPSPAAKAAALDGRRLRRATPSSGTNQIKELARNRWPLFFSVEKLMGHLASTSLPCRNLSANAHVVFLALFAKSLILCFSLRRFSSFTNDNRRYALILLFQSGGAGDFTIHQDALSREQTRTLFANAARLLRARGEVHAAEILTTIPFRLVDATNDFNDEFSMLYTSIPLVEYERLRNGLQNADENRAFQQVAMVLRELGTFVRFIAAELTLEPAAESQAVSDKRLTRREIHQLVYKYIGVSEGYLGNFSYRTHHEFYIELDLDINPNNYDGTTRERFIKILSESSPSVQAKILDGILRRYPVGSSNLRTKEQQEEIHRWIARLRGASPVELPDLRITSEIVERALQDAQELIKTSGATSGVDRVHTALHGYLKALCQECGLEFEEDGTLPELFKQICKGHPAFADLGPRTADIVRILRAIGTILDALNTLRNKASVAHPNPVLLPETESMLVINSVRTILHYLDEKVHRHSSVPQ